MKTSSNIKKKQTRTTTTTTTTKKQAICSYLLCSLILAQKSCQVYYLNWKTAISEFNVSSDQASLIIFQTCRLHTAKSRSAKGASHHPNFMVSSLTISKMLLPCPLSGKMGPQSWTVVVAIN